MIDMNSNHSVEDHSHPFGTDSEAFPIVLEGVRVHNLKNVSLVLPSNRLIALAGPSGSGKSSLAFDTIFAEGQRQYIESLSIHSRQFLHQLERPDADSITGLQPTIAIDQRNTLPQLRSTVATETEIYDYLRVLYARIGLAHCYRCGRPILSQSPEQIAEEILTLPQETRIMILAPVVRGTRGEHKEVLRQILKAGFVRARIDGALVEVEKIPTLDPNKPHKIEAIVDRLMIRDGIRPRLLESLKLAIQYGEGVVFCIYEKERIKTEEGTTRSIWKDVLFSTLYSCPKCKISYMELQPRTFSFNSPYGVCPTCEGHGKREEFDPELVVPDSTLSIHQGAIVPMKIASSVSVKKFQTLLDRFQSFYQRKWLKKYGPSDSLYDRSLSEWEPEIRNVFYQGIGEEDQYASLGMPSAILADREQDPEETFQGLFPLLEEIYATSRSKKEIGLLTPLRSMVRCHRCGGARIRPEARSVTIADRKIFELTAMSVEESIEWFEKLPSLLSDSQNAIVAPLIDQILSRLKFLSQIGLNYLTLDRTADSLSGGERQRVRLTNGLGNGLVGICYILDEPSVGLHPQDNQSLIDAMRQLQERGNTVLMVEHDESILRQADWLVDLGPGAGLRGGEILAQGSPEEVMANPRSLTGRYLTGAESIPVPQKRRKMVKSRSLTIEGVTTNNLKDITVSFPLGTFICVTGVSGSGKSSLLYETLVPALERRLNHSGPRPGNHKGLRGVSRIDKLIQIDQFPIGRSPRSNPATFCGLFDEIRKVFAASKDAKARGFQASRFSFNLPGGRCEFCQGQGIQKIEMHFLPDLYAPCPECEGKRFNPQTLEVKYRGKSIADVLNMPVDEALDFFSNHSAIARGLEGLKNVGLGYLPLGQSSTTFSGGEAQRIKLAAELSRIDTGNTFYVIDEPTNGLHTHDIRQLLTILTRLVDQGNTVVVIEHNLDVIKTADWVIDLGPEGGERGGELLFAGTPEELACQENSATGRCLRRYLNR